MRYTRLPGDYGAVLLHLHYGSVQQHLYVPQTPAQQTKQGIPTIKGSIIEHRTLSIETIVQKYTVTSVVEPYW
jgi:hypothetical protein